MKESNFFPSPKPSAARPPTPTTNSRPTRSDVGASRDEIARKAYFIYLDQGCPQGQDRQHWLQAEAQMNTARNASRLQPSAKV